MRRAPLTSARISSADMVASEAERKTILSETDFRYPHGARFPPSASAGRPVPPNRAPLSSANYCTTSVHERLFPSFRLGAQYGGGNRCFLIPCIPCMRPFESSCICPSLSRRFSLTAGSLPPTRDHRRAPEGSAAWTAAVNY